MASSSTDLSSETKVTSSDWTISEQKKDAEGNSFVLYTDTANGKARMLRIALSISGECVVQFKIEASETEAGQNVSVFRSRLLNSPPLRSAVSNDGYPRYYTAYGNLMDTNICSKKEINRFLQRLDQHLLEPLHGAPGPLGEHIKSHILSLGLLPYKDEYVLERTKNILESLNAEFEFPSKTHQAVFQHLIKAMIYCDDTLLLKLIEYYKEQNPADMNRVYLLCREALIHNPNHKLINEMMADLLRCDSSKLINQVVSMGSLDEEKASHTKNDYAAILRHMLKSEENTQNRQICANVFDILSGGNGFNPTPSEIWGDAEVLIGLAEKQRMLKDQLKSKDQEIAALKAMQKNQSPQRLFESSASDSKRKCFR